MLDIKGKYSCIRNMPSPVEKFRQCAEPHIPMLKDLSQSSKR